MSLKPIHIGIMHNEHGLILWLACLAVAAVLTMFFLILQDARNAEPAKDNSLVKFKLYYEKLESEERMVAMFKEHAKERQARMVARAQKEFGRLMTIALIHEAKHPASLQGVMPNMVS